MRPGEIIYPSAVRERYFDVYLIISTKTPDGQLYLPLRKRWSTIALEVGYSETSSVTCSFSLKLARRYWVRDPHQNQTFKPQQINPFKKGFVEIIVGGNSSRTENDTRT